MSALLQTHQKAMIDMQQASADAISELRSRLSNAEAELAAAKERSSLVEQSNEALSQRIMSQVEQVAHSVEAIDERIGGMKEGIDVLCQNDTVLQEYVECARAPSSRRTSSRKGPRSHRSSPVSRKPTMWSKVSSPQWNCSNPACSIEKKSLGKGSQGCGGELTATAGITAHHFGWGWRCQLRRFRLDSTSPRSGRKAC